MYIRGGGCFFVPGRIEVLGKHTDYAGGRSLVVAIDRGFVVSATPRFDRLVRVDDPLAPDTAVFDSDGRDQGLAMPSWSEYPRAVVRRCAANFPTATGGVNISFASNLPVAAGLSSSSAFIVAIFLALDSVRGMSRTAEYRRSITCTEDLAAYLGAIENGQDFRTLRGESGVGTMGGSQDHTAVLCARPGRLVQYSYAPVRFEGDVAMPPGYVFAIGSSGVRAEKTGAAQESYNRLSLMTQRLVQLWHDAGAGTEPTLAAITRTRDTAGDVARDEAGDEAGDNGGNGDSAAERLREIIRARAPGEAAALLARLDQFIDESERIVPAARAALARGDVAEFGELAERSQQHAERALLNQVPETVHLVKSARALGAVAASAFGAGFGGSVWALVREEDANTFVSAWRSEYDTSFGERAEAKFFTTGAGAPAHRRE